LFELAAENQATVAASPATTTDDDRNKGGRGKYEGPGSPDNITRDVRSRVAS
jgi:hypothetical protein